MRDIHINDFFIRIFLRETLCSWEKSIDVSYLMHGGGIGKYLLLQINAVECQSHFKEHVCAFDN
jgi:hypothetical protein